jgi:uncharacterized membrane protein
MEELGGLIRGIKVLCRTVVDTLIRIPIRIIKRLSGLQTAEVTFSSYSTEMFKCFCLLCLGTLVGAPAFLLSAMATIMLLITAEVLYVCIEGFSQFIAEA